MDVYSAHEGGREGVRMRKMDKHILKHRNTNNMSKKSCKHHMSSVFFYCTLPYTLGQCLRKCLRMPTRIAKGAYARGF